MMECHAASCWRPIHRNHRLAQPAVHYLLYTMILSMSHRSAALQSASRYVHISQPSQALLCPCACAVVCLHLAPCNCEANRSSFKLYSYMYMSLELSQVEEFTMYCSLAA